MKRAWRFCSNATRTQLLLFQFHFHGFSYPETIPSFTTTLSYRNLNTVSKDVSHTIPLLTAKTSSSSKEDLINKAKILRNELVRVSSDFDRVHSILDDNAESLNRRHPHGSVLNHLMNQLDSNPNLALQVQFLLT